MAEDFTFATPAEEAVTITAEGLPRIALDPVPIPPSYNFTPEQFKEDLNTFGLPNMTAAIVDIQQGSASEGAEYDYESLVDGTAPFLKKYGEKLVPGYRPGKGLNDEQILSLFTNVQDFAGESVPEMAAFMEGIKRTAPRAGGMLAGAIGGGKTAAALTAPIPPLGPPALVVKGGAILTGTVLGALMGDEAGDQLTDKFFGEAAPIVPSLQPYYNAAETGTYGISMLGAPSLLPRKAGATGALRFLDNFQRTAKGTASSSPVAQSLTQQIGKEVLSPKSLQKAIDAGKLGPRKGLLGKATTDPTKGPLSARALASVDEGVTKFGEFGRNRFPTYATLETLAAAGAGTAAYVAEEMYPGDDLVRFGFEFAGAGAVPLTAQASIKYAPQLIMGPLRLARKYLTGTAREEFDSKILNIAGSRIYDALVEAPTKPGFGELPELNDQQFELLIRALGDSLVDEKGQPLRDFSKEAIEKAGVGPGFATEFGVISAQLAAKNSPFSRVVNRIEQELERAGNELSVSSKKGREAYVQGAKKVIEEARRDGSTEALSLAAALQENLFNVNITDNLNAAISNLNNAVKQVTKGDPTVDTDSMRLAERVYDIVERQFKVSGDRAQRLWNNVDGNVEIRQFFSQDGQELTEPNLLSVFDQDNMQGGLKFKSQAAEDRFWNSMGRGMKADYDAIRNYYRQDGDAPELSDFFQERFDELQGRISDLSGPERLREIRDAAERTANAVFPNKVEPGSAQGNYIKALERLSENVSRPEVEFPVTTGRLVEMRSIALETARELRGNGKVQTAKNVDFFANAILDDLVNNPNFSNEAYNVARAYTKAQKDVFLRSFLGDLQEVTKKGDRRLSVGALMDKIKGAGSMPEYQRLVEIQEVGSFALRQDLEGAGDTLLTIHESLENVVRDAMKQIVDIKEVIDPVTNKPIRTMQVNPTKLSNYKKQPNTQEVFRVFPQLATDLADAQKAQDMFDQLGRDLKALKPTPETKAFQAVLLNESPTKAVTTALNSGKPKASMDELLSLTRTPNVINPKTGDVFSPQQIAEGLRIAILDHATTISGNTGLNFNPKTMYDVLFSTVKGSRPGDNMKLSTFLLDNELMTKEHLSSIQRALKEMINVEDAFARGDVEDVIFDKPTGAKMFQTRMIGATLGQAAQNQFNKILKKFNIDIGGGIGGGMVAAQEGSQQAQNLLFRMPEAARIRAMTEILNDPRALALMLMEQRTLAQQKSATSKINEFLVGGGLNFISRRAPYAERAISGEIEESGAGTPQPETNEQPTVDPVSSVAPAMMPAPPPVPAQRVAPPTDTLASAAPPPPAASGPVNRQQYAALFPNDSASAMIRQQGIGSLMG